MNMVQITTLILTTLLLAPLTACATARADAAAHSYSPAVPRAADFQVTVNGLAVDVCDANPAGAFADQPPKLPFPADPGAFAGFDFTGEAVVIVTFSNRIENIEVRPKRLGIVPQVEGNRATFRLSGPMKFGVEINGQIGRPLMIFAHAPEAQAPQPGEPGVKVYSGGALPAAEKFTTLFFPPGIHDLGPQLIEGWTNKTIYLAAGAWVKGGFTLRNCTQVVVCGRGVIERPNRAAPEVQNNALWFVKCCDCTAADVTVINHISGWTVLSVNSTNVQIRGVKVFSYSGGGDGIDVSGSENVTLDGCFVCTQDDGTALKSGRRLSNGRPLKNITVQNGTQWFSGLDVGFELWTETVENITVRNMDFVRPLPNGDAGNNVNIWRGVLKVNNCDHATVKNVRFEDIRIESPISNYLLSARIFRSYASVLPHKPGCIEDVTFRNIAVSGVETLPPSLFGGFGPDHLVQNVRVENLTHNGQPVRNPDLFKVNKFATNIILVVHGAEPIQLLPKKATGGPSKPAGPRSAPSAKKSAKTKPAARTDGVVPSWLTEVPADAHALENLFPGGDSSALKPFKVIFQNGKSSGASRFPDAWWAHPWDKKASCEISLGAAPDTQEPAFQLVNTSDTPALMFYTRKTNPIRLSAGRTYALTFDFLTVGAAEARLTVSLDGCEHHLRLKSDGQWQTKRIGLKPEGEGKLQLCFQNGATGAENALFLKRIAVFDVGTAHEVPHKNDRSVTHP